MEEDQSAKVRRVFIFLALWAASWFVIGYFVCWAQYNLDITVR